MVYSCGVVGCHVHLKTIPKPRLFRIPAIISMDNCQYSNDPKNHLRVIELSRLRRNAWLRALKRGSFDDKSINSIRICNNHFISGFMY